MTVKVPATLIKPDNYQPPQHKTGLFLAGSIENGKAEMWQDKAFHSLVDYELDIYNPRLDAWDSSLEYDSSNDILRHQIIWEQKHIEHVNHVLFYFDPNTTSPITLLELGQCIQASKRGKNVIVICPKGYYRYVNVEVTCQLNNISVYHTLEDGLNALKVKLFHLKR
jgi:hypothetical protein